VSSKKRSPISPALRLLELTTPLFLDRNQGNKQVPELLRKAGLIVECHSSYFKQEEDDDVWIKDCARRGWVIVTSDKQIEHDPVNRQAVIESAAKVFLLQENNSRAVIWASALVVSRIRMYEIINDTKGPFFADISRETGHLVGAPRKPDRDGPARIVEPEPRRSFYSAFVKF